MKTANERTFFLKPFYAFAIALLLILAASACEKSDSEDSDSANKLIGTWHQLSQTKDGITLEKDSTRLIMQINPTHICILCDSTQNAVTAQTIVRRSGWSFTEGLFSLAVDLPASWRPVATDQTLVLERIDFNHDGGISKTILSFERVADLEIQ